MKFSYNLTNLYNNSNSIKKNVDHIFNIFTTLNLKTNIFIILTTHYINQTKKIIIFDFEYYLKTSSFMRNRKIIFNQFIININKI